MPSCTVKWCRNHSRNSDNKRGIHWFVFPKDREQKLKWINAVSLERGEPEWFPTLYSRICSVHFNDDDYYRTKAGYVRLKSNVVPICTMVRMVTQNTVRTDIKDTKVEHSDVIHRTPMKGRMLSKPPQQPQQFIEFDVQPGPSSAAIQEQDSESDASRTTEFEVRVLTEPETGVEDPLANLNSAHQCRFCAKIAKNCIDASDKPYLKDNKTTLLLNDLNVEIAFNNDTRKVCLDCDRKLLEMFNFVKLVKNAQDALLNVSCDMEATETLVIKTECESPTPEDNTEIDDEDTKEGIVDSITIDETPLVNDVFVHKKRKCDDTKRPISKKQKKPKVDDNIVTYRNTELIIDIKEEPVEMDNDANNLQPGGQEDVDTGPDVKPSELDIATNALLNEMAGDAYS